MNNFQFLVMQYVITVQYIIGLTYNSTLSSVHILKTGNLQITVIQINFVFLYNELNRLCSMYHISV